MTALNPQQPQSWDELERLAEACPDNDAAGYCTSCLETVGGCRCAARYALRYATQKGAVLALLAELRAERRDLRRDAFVDVAAWLKTYRDEGLRFAASHIICNVNDTGGPGDESCLPLPPPSERLTR
jgi:hypothetical protein